MRNVPVTKSERVDFKRHYLENLNQIYFSIFAERINFLEYDSQKNNFLIRAG